MHKGRHDWQVGTANHISRGHQCRGHQIRAVQNRLAWHSKRKQKALPVPCQLRSTLAPAPCDALRLPVIRHQVGQTRQRAESVRSTKAARAETHLSMSSAVVRASVSPSSLLSVFIARIPPTMSSMPAPGADSVMAAIGTAYSCARASSPALTLCPQRARSPCQGQLTC